MYVNSYSKEEIQLRQGIGMIIQNHGPEFKDYPPDIYRFTDEILDLVHGYINKAMKGENHAAMVQPGRKVSGF